MHGIPTNRLQLPHLGPTYNNTPNSTDPNKMINRKMCCRGDVFLRASPPFPFLNTLPYFCDALPPFLDTLPHFRNALFFSAMLSSLSPDIRHPSSSCLICILLYVFIYQHTLGGVGSSRHHQDYRVEHVAANNTNNTTHFTTTTLKAERKQ